MMNKYLNCLASLWISVGLFPVGSCFIENAPELPRFGDSVANVSVSAGRDAALVCVVEGIGSYRVAWLRVDTQTILTIATLVITKNHRIGVTHSARRAWFLHVYDARQTDRGWYMCQINTDPMKSQTAYLDVVVPPDILDLGTSGDQVAREGGAVSLRCAAHGVPLPAVAWRRETGSAPLLTPGTLHTENFTDAHNSSVGGAVLLMSRVTRLHMGAYLCIAANGVPPSVSKRVMLIVHFPPMVWIQNQLIGASEGDHIVLECHSEAYPKSINYWTLNDEIISQADKNYEISTTERGYEIDMRLAIKRVTGRNYGSYLCVSKNSLGDTDGSIKLYPISATSGKQHSEKQMIKEDMSELQDKWQDATSPGLSSSNATKHCHQIHWIHVELLLLMLMSSLSL